MQNLISANFDKYLFYLKELVNKRSPFTEAENVKIAINYCKRILEGNLKNYEIYFDSESNLIAKPFEVDSEKEIVYLSAHIDTADADEKEWTVPYHPYKVYENENEIVGRGVNDCKAGVSYQLFLTYLAKEKLIDLKNIVFTITFKEEGSGNKTSQEIARNFGVKLPLSKKSTYLIVLENNVRVQNPAVLCVYFSERSNYAIKITDSLPKLQVYLKKLKHFNPTCIYPEKEFKDSKFEKLKQLGGHVCSISKDENLLTKIILETKENSIIKAGNEKNFATVPSEIFLSENSEGIKHTMVLNNRSFDSLEKVLKQLEGIEYEQLKHFSISAGFNIEEKIKGNKVLDIFKKCNDSKSFDLEFTYNVGGSDGTIMCNSMDPKLRKNFYPIVMGPGSRSQKNIDPPRVTHGRNETFDKRSGKEAVIFISKILKEMDFI